MMRSKLTIFEAEGVSYLSVGISHGLCDGHGIVDIMQTWSHFCGASSSSSNGDAEEGLPAGLRRRRTLGERTTEPVRPAENYAALRERAREDVGCEFDPLSRYAFYGRVLPRAIAVLSRQRVTELRVDGEEMAALKRSVVSALPEGEWASTFEVMCAAIIVAQRATAASSGPCAREHTLHVGTNLRDRANRFPSDYFGNASFDFRKPISLPREADWTDIVDVAKEVHNAVRSGLADPEDITRTKDWFEAARYLGHHNKYDIWQIIFDLLKGTGTFVNSWDSRWMKISMGGEKDARAFAAFLGVMQNIIVEVPRERKSGDTTIHLALPSGHMERFLKYCKSCEDKNKDTSAHRFPFHVV
mmetsp:Transcript_3648/g.9818  ORF Transcript_3648/g.9818 Transcript_3648/m.9818 type:complete len:358 (+) Transcript_3648:1248-2321(+)